MKILKSSIFALILSLVLTTGTMSAFAGNGNSDSGSHGGGGPKNSIVSCGGDGVGPRIADQA